MLTRKKFLLLLSGLCIASYAVAEDGIRDDLDAKIESAFSGKTNVVIYIESIDGVGVKIKGFESFSPMDIFNAIKRKSSREAMQGHVPFMILLDAYRRSKSDKLRDSISKWLVQSLYERTPATFSGSRAISTLAEMMTSLKPTDTQRIESVLPKWSGTLDGRSIRAIGSLLPHLSEEMRKRIRGWGKATMDAPVNPWLLVLARHGDSDAMQELLGAMTPQYRASRGVMDMVYIGTPDAYQSLCENLLVDGFVSAGDHPLTLRLYGANSAMYLTSLVQIQNCPEEIMIWAQTGAWDGVVDLRNWILSQRSITIKGISRAISVQDLRPPKYSTPQPILRKVPRKYRGERGLERYREDVADAKESVIRMKKRNQKQKQDSDGRHNVE